MLENGGQRWSPFSYGDSINLVNMNSSGRFFFGLRAFDVGIRVECDSAEVREELDRFLLPPVPRCQVPANSSVIEIRVQENPDGFQILFNDHQVSEVITLHDAVRETVKALDDALVDRLRSLRAVHAGAVVFAGRALLIPGSTHAGKSSLVAELLRRGAIHLSDEYALVDQEGRVHAYPRPLLLRNGSSKQSLVLPQAMNSRFATEPVPVGWIVAVDYVPEAEWKIREISQGEAVMLLLRNTPHEMADKPEMTDFFIRLAANAVSYTGTRGEAVEAASRVLELVSRK